MRYTLKHTTDGVTWHVVARNVSDRLQTLRIINKGLPDVDWTWQYPFATPEWSTHSWLDLHTGRVYAFASEK